MRIRSAVSSAALLLTTAASLTAQDGKGEKLRYSFEKGTEADLQVEQTADMQMNMNGRNMQTTMNTTMFWHLQVTDVKDGVATIEAKVKRVIGDMQVPMMGTTHFDTNDEDSVPNQFEQFLDMIDKPIKAQVTERGELQDIDVDKAAQPSAHGGGADLKQSMQQFMAELPADPVAVGGDWDTSYPMEMGPMGKVEIKVHNQLTALQGPHATVQQKLSMGEMSKDAQMRMQLTDAGGTMGLNLDQGLPESMDMTMHLTVSGGPMPGEMKMTNKVHAKRVAADAYKAKVEGKEPADANGKQPAEKHAGDKDGGKQS